MEHELAVLQLGEEEDRSLALGDPVDSMVSCFVEPFGERRQSFRQVEQHLEPGCPVGVLKTAEDSVERGHGRSLIGGIQLRLVTPKEAEIGQDPRGPGRAAAAQVRPLFQEGGDIDAEVAGDMVLEEGSGLGELSLDSVGISPFLVDPGAGVQNQSVVKGASRPPPFRLQHLVAFPVRPLVEEVNEVLQCGGKA
jgi:hypothetical protein